MYAHCLISKSPPIITLKSVPAMSFKFPSFSLQALQDSLPSVDLENITKSLSNANASKTVQQYLDQFKHSIEPFASKTGQLLLQQLHQVQQLAATHINNANIEVSELPHEYLELEQNCDKLLKFYTALTHFINDTYAQTAYDYPPGNTSLSKIRDANVGGLLGSKFSQLRNALSPQELEKILLGQTPPKDSEGTSESEPSDAPAAIPRTLFHQLSALSASNADDLRPLPLATALGHLGIAYKQVGEGRLHQDHIIIEKLNSALVRILDEEFVKVTELRKRVYAARVQFDVARAGIDQDTEDENEGLIAKEDELVNATELAVTAMKRLLRPADNVSLLKVFVAAQREYFETAATRLAAAAKELDQIELEDDEE